MTGTSGQNTNYAKIRQRGFTLLEFIIAISLLVVFMTFIYSTILHTTRVTTTLEQHIRRQHRVRSLFEGIIREMRSISDDSRAPLLPPPGSNSAGSTPLFFKASKTPNGSTFTFIASEVGLYLPGRKNQTGLVQLTYRVEEDPEIRNRKVLVREEVPVIFPTQTAFENAIVIPINKDIVVFQARFFDPVSKTWREDWTATSSAGENGSVRVRGKVPALIEIHLAVADTEGREREYTTVIATRALD